MSSTTFFFIFIPVLSILLLSINLILAPHKPYQEKKSVFECGFSSFRGMNRKEFIVSFFLFGLLFISFDMELVATFPFATSAYNSSTYSVVVVILFLLVLTLGFVFELGKNALVIDSRQTSSYNDVETPPSHAFLASSNETPLEPNSLNSLPLKSTLDPMGLIANAAHVVASADCLHATREYLTMSTSEILKGQYPMCDFNPINGVQHSVLNLNNRTFAYCTSCLSVICAKCDLSQGSQSSQAFMLITSCNIFKTLLFNTKEYIFSVFGKNRSVAPYILIVLSCFIVFLCNDFSVTYVDLVPFFSMTVVCRSPENDITGKGSSGDPAKDLCSARDDGNHVFEHTVPQDSKPGDDTTVDCSNCDENIDLLSESARICIQCADTYCTPCFSNLDVKCDASRA
jgi:NADH-ubiquinone oxidoreductase chain 3